MPLFIVPEIIYDDFNVLCMMYYITGRNAEQRKDRGSGTPPAAGSQTPLYDKYIPCSLNLCYKYSAMDNVTPMLRQYQELKSKYQDHILFFRLGDFYEMFYDDARTASPVLNVVLTSRDAGKTGRIPMCGIPYHARDNYIAKLVKAGFKVAICEQVEDPAKAQGIVKRDIVKVITSGTFIDETNYEPRYIASLLPDEKSFGIAFMDITNGHIQANEYADTSAIADLISRFSFSECIFPLHLEERIRALFKNPLLRNKTITLSGQDDWYYNLDISRKSLCEHFKTQSLRGFGLEDLPHAVAAAGALLEYVKQANHAPLRHICKLSLYAESNHVFISPAAVDGLDLESLFKTLDNTLTAFGRRCLRNWLSHPLKQRDAILKRQQAVTLLKENESIRNNLSQLMRNLPDIEKSITRISSRDAAPRDLAALRSALTRIPELQKTLESAARENGLFVLNDIPELRALLETAINPDIPLSNPEGKIIKQGYHAELDSIRAIQTNARDFLKNLQAKEIKRTGINSLKIGYNHVFGYYIECTKANLSSIPADYIRKQTLANAERFITPELKEYEEKILNAQDTILCIEGELINEISRRILDHARELQSFSTQLATLDSLYSLSMLTLLPGYCLPEISESTQIRIDEGRHPVVERAGSDSFIPNDTLLDCDTNHLIIITGPNMAGKSTYIRQTAVLVIMAQIGSYIPAKAASIGLVDKIFTRIGAHDDINRGQSTFMVEMSETAGILNNLSERSLVILDEIGRGTSTYDGLSLAWAIAEYLQEHTTRTLFATHFHELTALAQDHPGVKNYNVAVKEWNDEVIFLHKIVPGGTDDSYGIYVAKLAGIPQPVIARSKDILARLELSGKLHDKIRNRITQESQLSFVVPQSSEEENNNPIIDEITNLDINTLTPLAVAAKVQEWKEKLKNHGKNKRPTAGHRQ